MHNNELITANFARQLSVTYTQTELTKQTTIAHNFLSEINTTIIQAAETCGETQVDIKVPPELWINKSVHNFVAPFLIRGKQTSTSIEKIIHKDNLNAGGQLVYNTLIGAGYKLVLIVSSYPNHDNDNIEITIKISWNHVSQTVELNEET